MAPKGIHLEPSSQHHSSVGSDSSRSPDQALATPASSEASDSEIRHRDDVFSTTDEAAEAIELQQLKERDSLSDSEEAFTNTSIRRPQLQDETIVSYTPAEERKVLKKLDRHLVLFLALLYMLSFLDRSSKFMVSGFSLG
jgi:hypothetical protein